MTGFDEPVVAWRGATDPAAPLVVLWHGRGSNEADIIALADHLPDGLAYAAVRAPIGEGGGYAWFANRGIGRPLAESLADTMAWFRTWLDDTAPTGRPVLVAHGDTDMVIPRDLLERTWTYLHGDAASTTTGVRDPGGHGLSAHVVDELSRWLTDVIDKATTQ